MNKHHVEYLILFEDDERHRAPDYFNARRFNYGFDYLRDARSFARRYPHTYIFKFYLAPDTEDILYWHEVK